MKRNTGAVPLLEGHRAGVQSLAVDYAGYLRGRTESFIALPTLNLSVVFAGI